MDPFALIRQLQGALGGKRFLTGSVDNAGAVVTGSGFSVVKNATGDYTVTFTVAFGGIPSVDVGMGIGGTALFCKLHAFTAPSTTGFRVLTFSDTTPTAADGGFTFVASGTP